MSSLTPASTTIPQQTDSTAKGVDLQALRQRLKDLFAHPELLPNDFLSFVTDFVSVNQPVIPISQINGFDRFTANFAAVATSQTTTSASYVSLATTGPELTDIPDGIYVVTHGALMASSADGSRVFQSISVNGGSASDGDAAQNGNLFNLSACTSVQKSLSGGTNTITCKYRTNSSVTGTFANRFVLAQRVSNL